MASRTPLKDDFVAADIARQVDDHGKDMVSITKRLDELETKFGTNEKIANTLCEVEASAVRMADCFEKSLIKILGQSEPVNKQINKIIAEADRSYIAQQLKQYRTWIYGGLLFILAQVAIEAVRWIFSLLHPNIPPHI